MKMSLPDQAVYAEHAAIILARAAELTAEARRFALITSLAIEGGAARQTGSLALVDEDGGMTGYLSNGCIDRDIQHHAIEALGGATKRLIRYGDGSRFADLKLPCGGSLMVLIDPAPDVDALRKGHAALTARQSATLTFTAPPDGDGTPPLTGTFRYAPRLRLVLAGRGAVFRAVAQVGHATGFEVALMSPDADDLDAIAHLSVAPPRHLTSPDADHTGLGLDAHSAFLTLFHDHDWEPELLRAALASKAPFIGSLGSTRSHALRLEALRQMGVADHDLARLRGPIGLVPSLRDAPFIAVSSIAEIVAAFPTSIQQVSADTPLQSSLSMV